MMKVEIMDTTLRDGEQTQGVAYTPLEKLHLASFLLKELGVNRIEVASARVSEGEFRATKKIIDWAKENGFHQNVEVLGFVDGDISLNWIKEAGGKVLNLLTKGSYKHVTKQLRKTPEQHVDDIKKSVAKAREMGIEVNIYLEDWSNGMLESEDYVFFLMDALKEEPIRRFMLPDTLGVLNPDQSFELIKKMTGRYPELWFDFHAHNDYDLAVANAFEAVKAGAKGIHVTVNGLGERAGNAPLSSVIAVIHDHLNFTTDIKEEKINQISRLVETFSGIRIPFNKPVIGESVFTQTSGVHADGDNKDNLYFNRLMPERFGRKRVYALGKLSGKANIEKNLQEMGLHLTPESLKKVTKRVIELGDKKETVTPEDLPFIISDVLRNGHNDKKITIKNYSLSISASMKPVASVQIEIDGDEYEEAASGDGQYDAFMNALWKIYHRLGKSHPMLKNYRVSIPPGGKTDALVETRITWDYGGKQIVTKGLDADQTVSAIKATERMLNIIENVY